jgi:hypothetical protein
MAASSTPQPGQARNRGGRPSKLTPALITAIADELALGPYPLAGIARTHSIHRVTLWRWLDIGRHRPDTPYGELVRAIKNARRRFLRRQRTEPSLTGAALARDLLAERERHLQDLLHAAILATPAASVQPPAHPTTPGRSNVSAAPNVHTASGNRRSRTSAVTDTPLLTV